jgi:hypothetical protein
MIWVSGQQPERVVPFRPKSYGEPWVSAQTVARHFAVSVRTVQRWRQGGCPCLGRGGMVRFRLSAVEAWLAGQA